MVQQKLKYIPARDPKRSKGLRSGSVEAEVEIWTHWVPERGDGCGDGGGGDGIGDGGDGGDGGCGGGDGGGGDGESCLEI